MPEAASVRSSQGPAMVGRSHPATGGNGTCAAVTATSFVLISSIGVELRTAQGLNGPVAVHVAFTSRKRRVARRRQCPLSSAASPSLGRTGRPWPKRPYSPSPESQHSIAHVEGPERHQRQRGSSLRPPVPPCGESEVYSRTLRTGRVRKAPARPGGGQPSATPPGRTANRPAPRGCSALGRGLLGIARKVSSVGR